MFSSSELLHLVFANENDIFYCDNLLKLDLNQYLWWTLHKEGYQAVYFLHPEKEGFTVRTYGDKKAKPYAPESGIFKRLIRSETRQFGDWMIQQLKAKGTDHTAFVCPLRGFCDTAESEEWQKVLEEIAGMKNRTGIILLTASPEAEQSRELLMSSRVFDALKEKEIINLRGGDVRPVYQSLASGKPNGVVYLNAFTKERMKALLLHVMMDEADYDAAPAQIDHGAEYLTQYYINPWLRKRSPLFGAQNCNEQPKYCEIYLLLMNRKNWDRLMKQVQEVYAKGRSLKDYLNENESDYCNEADAQVCVMRDRNSVAGSCMNLWLPPNQAKAKTIEDENAVFENLMDIQTTLGAPANRTDNLEIEKAIGELLTNQEIARSEGDFDTLKRAVFSMQFFARWLYVPEKDEKEKNILSLYQSLKTMIALSRNCFQTNSNLGNLARFSNNPRASQLIKQQVMHLELSSAAKQKQLEELEALVTASIVKLSVNDSAKKIADMATNLQEQIDALQAEHTAEIEPEPELEPESNLEPEADEFTITEADEYFLSNAIFDATPPPDD